MNHREALRILSENTGKKWLDEYGLVRKANPTVQLKQNAVAYLLERRGEDFPIVFVRDRAEFDDFFAIPYAAIKSILTEQTLDGQEYDDGATRVPRWMLGIRGEKPQYELKNNLDATLHVGIESYRNNVEIARHLLHVISTHKA